MGYQYEIGSRSTTSFSIILVFYPYFVGEKNLINLLLFKIAFKQKSQEVL